MCDAYTAYPQNVLLLFFEQLCGNLPMLVIFGVQRPKKHDTGKVSICQPDL